MRANRLVDIDFKCEKKMKQTKSIAFKAAWLGKVKMISNDILLWMIVLKFERIERVESKDENKK